MYYVLTEREQLLRFFPGGAVGAEIGVAQGAFSAAILERARPRELHLIDPWSHLEPGSGLLEGAGLLAGLGAAPDDGGPLAPPPPNQAGDADYASIVARFAGDPRVRLHRQYSYRIAPSFAADMFDFVYLDGNHHYEFVLRDLEDFAARLKPGGLLFGHDYFEDDFARREHYGVVEAVGTFLKRSDFRLVMLTWEPFSTFCLARSLDGFAGELLRNLLDSEVAMIELPDAIAANYRDRAHARRDGSVRRIPSFSTRDEAGGS
jgi:SAM-dependent methyltransferase